MSTQQVNKLTYKQLVPLLTNLLSDEDQKKYITLEHYLSDKGYPNKNDNTSKNLKNRFVRTLPQKEYIIYFNLKSIKKYIDYKKK